MADIEDLGVVAGNNAKDDDPVSLLPLVHTHTVWTEALADAKDLTLLDAVLLGLGMGAFGADPMAHSDSPSAPPAFSFQAISAVPSATANPSEVTVKVVGEYGQIVPNPTLLFNATDVTALQALDSSLDWAGLIDAPRILYSEEPDASIMVWEPPSVAGVYYMGLTANVYPTGVEQNVRTGLWQYTGVRPEIGFTLRPDSVSVDAGTGDLTFVLDNCCLLGATATAVDYMGRLVRVWHKSPLGATSIVTGAISYSGGKNQVVIAGGMGEGASASTDTNDYRVFVRGPVLTDFDLVTNANQRSGVFVIGTFEMHATNPWETISGYGVQSTILPPAAELARSPGPLQAEPTAVSGGGFERTWRFVRTLLASESTSKKMIELISAAATTTFYARGDGRVYTLDRFEADAGFRALGPDSTGINYALDPDAGGKRYNMKWTPVGMRLSPFHEVGGTSPVRTFTGTWKLASNNAHQSQPLLIMHNGGSIAWGGAMVWHFDLDFLNDDNTDDEPDDGAKFVLLGLSVVAGRVDTDLDTFEAYLIRQAFDETIAVAEEVIFFVNGSGATPGGNWPISGNFGRGTDWTAGDNATYGTEGAGTPHLVERVDGSSRKWHYFLRLVYNPATNPTLDSSSAGVSDTASHEFDFFVRSIELFYRRKAAEA